MKLYLRPILLTVLFTFVLIALPTDLVQAQTSDFVKCSGPDCSACNLVELINTLIKWLFGIIFLIFAVLMLISGFGLVTSGGNQSALDAAKKKFQNGIIGLLIVMSAWIMVDTMMRGLLKGGAGDIAGYGPWSQVQCQVQTEVFPAVKGTGFPPIPASGNSYQFYEQDTVKNCKIARGGSGPDLAACSSALSAAIASAKGPTYVVDACDPDATLPTPPSWSTLPACGVSNTACTPLTNYSGSDPLGVEWVGTDPRLKACVIKFAGSLGPVASAYRPQAYQDHIKEVHTKWCAQGLSVNTDPSCSAVKSSVGSEMAKHALSCSRPVATVSNHTSGLAVDISSSISPSNSSASCLTWFGPKDPVHYTLRAGCVCN